MLNFTIPFAIIQYMHNFKCLASIFDTIEKETKNSFLSAMNLDARHFSQNT
jgi:hypothetical protein